MRFVAGLVLWLVFLLSIPLGGGMGAARATEGDPPAHPFPSLQALRVTGASPASKVSPAPTASPASTQPWEGGGDRSHANLVGRAIDPISNLGRVELEEAFNPSYTNSRSSGNTFSIKPVIPITSKDFPDQLLRVNIPIQWSAGRQTAMGDVQVFDLFGDAQEWGRLGFGPVFVLPTANTRAAGDGKWQVGPALGFVYTRVPHACLGFLAQNPISVAGDPARKEVNHLWFQPLLTWQVGRGWYLVSDGQMTFDWLDRGVRTPLGR